MSDLQEIREPLGADVVDSLHAGCPTNCIKALNDELSPRILVNVLVNVCQTKERCTKQLVTSDGLSLAASCLRVAEW